MNNTFLLGLILAEDEAYQKHQRVHRGFLILWCLVLCFLQGCDIPSFLFWLGNLAAFLLHIFLSYQRDVAYEIIGQYFAILAKNLKDNE